MLRNCLSALLNSLSNNFSGEKDSPKRKRQKTVSRTRTLRFEPCEDRTMLSVSPFNSGDVTAHWTFDVNTEDTNGAFIGTLNNGASLTTNGIAGGGLSLDGVDDYFSIGNPEELQILNEITLAAWIVPETASGVQNIIAKGYSTHPNGEIFLRIANGKYQVGSWTGSEHLAEFVIPSSDIGERVHLAGTYDGTTWRLYRNGVEIASTVDNTGAVEVDGAWAVGARGTGTERFYSGVIDEVVISSTAYTAQEIAALASIPTNAQEDNSVTWNWSDVQNGEIYSEQGDSLGTLTNGAYIQTDLNYGQVLNLSGNNGYVSLGNPDDLQIFGKITLSAWICPDSLTGIQNIIVKGYASNPDGEIFLRIANGEYQVGSWNGTNYYVSAIADTDDIGQWIQLTGVYDGDTWRLYKNCVEVAATSSSVGAVPVNANWTIGSSASDTDRFFNGKIGACGIYDHALDAQAIAALMSDNQTTARVGGNHYAIKGQSYQLQLDASNPDVLWTVNWGDGTTDYYYNVSSASHVYTHYGTSGVSVTAKQNGRTIDVAGSSIALQIGAVGNMVTNGDFEDVEFQTNETWIVSNDVTGWSGRIEIQGSGGNKIAELDTDNRSSSLDQNPGDDQPHHTTITSDSMTFIPGLTYTLSFDAWNRSDYTQDNVLSVTIPGSIVKINGTSKADLLDLIDDNANLSEEDNIYAYTSISTSSVTFSAGGTTYKVSDGEGGTTDVSGASPFHVSSITFVATSNSGSVSFSDVSSDVIPGYGLLLDNISMNQEYLYVDIDVDSNNDGTINEFDDTVEMAAAQSGSIESGAYGYIVLAGEQFSVNLNTISSRLLDGSIYGVRLLDSAGILDFSDAYLHQSTATITAEQTGQTTLAYEIYLIGTNQVVARDEVLITVQQLSISVDNLNPDGETDTISTERLIGVERDYGWFRLYREPGSCFTKTATVTCILDEGLVHIAEHGLDYNIYLATTDSNSVITYTLINPTPIDHPNAIPSRTYSFTVDIPAYTQSVYLAVDGLFDWLDEGDVFNPFSTGTTPWDDEGEHVSLRIREVASSAVTQSGSYSGLGSSCSSYVEIKDGGICAINTDSNNDGAINQSDTYTSVKNDTNALGRLIAVNNDDDDNDKQADLLQKPIDFDIPDNPAALNETAPALNLNGENDLAEVQMYVWVDSLTLESELNLPVFVDVYTQIDNDFVMWTESNKGSHIHSYDSNNPTQTRLIQLSSGSGQTVFRRTVYMEAEVANTGTVTLIGEPQSNDPTGSDTIKLTSFDFDVDMNTDNFDGTDIVSTPTMPQRNEREELYEDHQYGLGIVMLCDEPLTEQVEGPYYYPIVLDIGLPFYNMGFNPTVSFAFQQYDPNNGVAGDISLYKMTSGGAYVELSANHGYTLSELGFANGATSVILYVLPQTRHEVQSEYFDPYNYNNKPDSSIIASFSIGTVQIQDTIRYINSSLGSFWNNYIHDSAIRHAFAAQAVYGSNADTPYSHATPTSTDLPQFGLQWINDVEDFQAMGFSSSIAGMFGANDLTGLNVAVYYDHITGNGILTFQGSDPIRLAKWNTELREALGYDSNVNPDSIGTWEFLRKIWSKYPSLVDKINNGIIGGSSAPDWICNIAQSCSSVTPQYDAAMDIGSNLPKNFVQLNDAVSIDKITGWAITGHSLGGGLASAAAGVCGNIVGPGYIGNSVSTFNAAGLHNDSVRSYLSRRELPDPTPGVSPSIIAYRTESDELTEQQEESTAYALFCALYYRSSVPIAKGTPYWLEDFVDDTIINGYDYWPGHEMKSVIQGLLVDRTGRLLNKRYIIDDNDLSICIRGKLAKLVLTRPGGAYIICEGVEYEVEGFYEIIFDDMQESPNL